MDDYSLIKSTNIFNGKIIDVVVDEIIMPNGNIAKREVVKHIGAASVLPIDSEDNIIFVRQYRHPAKQFLLEIPAGTLEIGENPAICASRELEEEIGYKGEVNFMYKMYTAVGFCNQIMHVYYADNLTLSKQNLDEDEFITIEKYPFDVALAMIKDGTIVDSETISAILYYNNFIRKNK